MGGIVRKKNKEAEELKEALAELQEQEKKRNPNFKPRRDFVEEVRQRKGQS